MLKLLKNNSFVVIGILIVSVLVFITGFILTTSYKSDIKDQIKQEHFDKLGKFKKVLETFNSFNKNKLLLLERVYLNLFQNKDFLVKDISDSVLVEAKSVTDSIIGVHAVKNLMYGKNKIYGNIDFFDDLTYNTDVFIRFWQKTQDGYILSASNDPEVKFGEVTLFLDKSQELVKDIEKGSKTIITEYQNFDSRKIKTIPLYIEGEINAFIQIVLYENSSATFNKIFKEEHSDFFIMDKTGMPLIGDKDIENNSEEYTFLPVMIANRGKLKTLEIESNSLYYSYLPGMQLFIGFLVTEDYIQLRSKNYSLKIWLSVIISGLLVISFLLLFNFRNRNKQRSLLRRFNKILLLNGESSEEITEKPSEKYIPEKLEEYIDDIYEYTSKINDEEFNIGFETLSRDDKLAVKLTGLKEKIKATTEMNIERAEDENLRAGLSEGRAKITELLQYGSDIKELGFKIIKSTVEFLNIQLGGMFILDETDPENPILEMIASYAYDKRRYANKRITVKEGLIGRAYLERDSIYITEIPENYSLIESGFGEETPKSLLIVPLIFNNKVQAVVELASNDLIEDYQIKYIESIGENIASTISNLKHSKQTEELLEQTRLQSKEIEEQRQTLEEKINTHRKQNRKLDKEILQLIEIIESIKSITYMIEYDLRGTIMDVSSKTLNLFNATKEELITVHHKDFITNDKYDEIYESFWIELEKNKTQQLEEFIIYKDKEFRLLQSYVPIRNARRKIYRILSIGTLMT